MLHFAHDGHFYWCSVEKTKYPSTDVDCTCKIGGYVTAILVGTAIFLLELWGAHHSGSLSLLGDGIHVFADVGVYGAALFAGILKYRGNASDTSSIDALWGIRIANILIFVGIVIGVVAVGRMAMNPTPHIDSWTMLWVAVIGLVANVFILWLFYALAIDHDHSHTDEHNHSHSEDMVHKGALVHIITDTLLSVIVVMSAVIMFFGGPSVTFIDGIATIAVACLLLYLARDMKRTIRK